MVEMMEPCSDPSSTSAETWAMLAQGTRMLENISGKERHVGSHRPQDRIIGDRLNDPEEAEAGGNGNEAGSQQRKIRPEAMAKAKNKGGKERGENAENAGDLSDPVHFR